MAKGVRALSVTAPFTPPPNPLPDSLLNASSSLRAGIDALRRLGLITHTEHQGILYHFGAPADSDHFQILPDSQSTISSINPYMPAIPAGAVPVARAHVHPFGGQYVPQSLGGGYGLLGPSPADLKVANAEGIPSYAVDANEKGNVYRIAPDSGWTATTPISLMQALGITPMPASSSGKKR